MPILSGKVDIANVRLELESGCVANFTASRVSTERVRKLRFFQPRQYVSVDYGRQEVLVFTVGQDGATAGAPSIASVNPQIQVAKPPVASEEPLHAELKSFCAPCGSVPRQQYPSKTDTARFRWRSRLWPPFENTGRKSTSPASQKAGADG